MRKLNTLDITGQHYYARHTQTLLPHCSLVTVNSITCSNSKCWPALEGLSELGISLITCSLTHKQPCPPCSHVQLTTAISIGGELPAVFRWSVQLSWAATFLFCYRSLLPRILPLLQRAPQPSNVQGKRRGTKRKTP